MRPDRKGTLISKVLVERDDDGAFYLDSLEHFPVGLSLEPDVLSVGDGPSGALLSRPDCDSEGDILVEKDREAVRQAG